MLPLFMNVGPCHHRMARPRDGDGGTSSNKLNKHPRTADEGWSASLGLDEVLTTTICKKCSELLIR